MMSDQEQTQIETLPLLPIKNQLLFPYLQMPRSVGRATSMAAIDAAIAIEEKQIVVVTQRDATVEEPQQNDLYSIGTKAIIRRMVRPREDAIDIVVQGGERVTIIRV